jgi:hypothetical protein
MLVREAVERARLHEATPRFVRVGHGVDFEQAEHVVRVVNAAEDPLHRRLLTRPWTILIEHRPPGVVVAHLDPSGDER